MAVTIIELALVAFGLIALIIGAVRGFIRQLTGIMSGIVSVVLAFVLSGALLNAFKSTGIFASLSCTASSWFKGNVFSTAVSSQEELVTVLQSSKSWTAFSGLAPAFFAEMSALNLTTFGELLGYYVSNAIVYAFLWLLILVLLKITIKSVGNLLQKVAKLPILGTVDRILGAICSVGIVYLVLITLLLTGIEVFIFKYVNGSWNTLCTFIKQSKLLTFLNNTNYLGILLAKYANVVLPTL